MLFLFKFDSLPFRIATCIFQRFHYTSEKYSSKPVGTAEIVGHLLNAPQTFTFRHVRYSL